MFKRVLGFIWAAPATVVGLAYVLPLWALGWYQFLGKRDVALVWLLSKDAPRWLTKIWSKPVGHTIGNVIALKLMPDTDRGRVTLKHEQQHARQYMRLGAFFPVLYAVAKLSIKLACDHCDSHYSNPFEIDARRAAGQIVDVEGTVKRLKAYAQK